MYLRVVQGPSGFDALDQPADTPRDDETVWVYRMVGAPRIAFLDYSGKEKSKSGRYDFSDYDYLEVDDDVRERIRDLWAWREWVQEFHEAQEAKRGPRAAGEG